MRGTNTHILECIEISLRELIQNEGNPFFQQAHKSFGDVNIVCNETSKEINLSFKSL
jgi:hypothetical protein